MKTNIKDISPSKRIMLTAAVVALSSQLYFNFYSSGFRVSAAVILLPVLLMTVGRDISTIKICTVTALTVFIFRSAVHFAYYGSDVEILASLFPNGVFYIAYGLIFTLLCPNKNTVSYSRMFINIFCCDFVSNICEMCITSSNTPFDSVTAVIASLFLIALVRSVIAWGFLVGEKQYRTLLQKEEHEKRYQRLFMMTTGLKSEIYFMKKNSEEIEQVMGNAYRLYEYLSDMQISDDIKKMSLAIAKDVHEIKKDYLSIIKGIEKEISEDFDEKSMKLEDIFTILQDTTYHLLESRNLKISLDFRCQDNFVTSEHYEIMSILKNLVSNAAEAIESDETGDKISIIQTGNSDNIIFTVTDNGPGISKRHINNIFKMGYSTKFDTVTGNIYRGVGLYGVKTTIEEKFGGTIEVNSTFGEGTEFIITLPKVKIIDF